MSYDIISYLMYAYEPYNANPLFIKDLLNHADNFTKLDKEYTTILRDTFNGSLLEFLEAVTVDCESFITACVAGLQDSIQSDDTKCCGPIFDETPYYTAHGKCWSTKGKNKGILHFPSVIDPLTVIVCSYNNAPEKLNPKISNWDNMAIDGVRYALHDSDYDHPKAVALKNLKSVPLNKAVNIAIDEQIIDYSYNNKDWRFFLVVSLCGIPCGIPLWYPYYVIIW